MSALKRHVPNKAGVDRALSAVSPSPVQGPMSQQASFGSHGYDMHPQTFVRLVGYQTSEAAEHQTALYERAEPKAA